MQINAINNYSKTTQQTNFKAAYPVIYWVKDASKQAGTQSAPTITEGLTSKLQGKLVRYLNRTFSKSDPQKVTLMGKAFSFLRSWDRDYGNYPIVRSFYNPSAGSQKEGLKPIAYLLTGKDVEIFENNYAKDIGRTKANSPVIGSNTTTPSTSSRCSTPVYFKVGTIQYGLPSLSNSNDFSPNIFVG